MFFNLNLLLPNKHVQCMIMSVQLFKVVNTKTVAEGTRNDSWFSNVKKYANPFHYQLKILMKRAVLNVIRNPAALTVVVCGC